jgi:hypothetical protein
VRSEEDSCGVEDTVTDRETCDANLDDHYRRNFVLKQPSTVGPRMALGLGVALVAFVGYLVYVNVLLPPSAAGSPEHLLSPEGVFTSPLPHSKRTAQRPPGGRQPAVTVVLQGRAANALLGGQGPALPPEYAITLVVPPSPRVSPQTSAGRQ